VANIKSGSDLDAYQEKTDSCDGLRVTAGRGLVRSDATRAEKNPLKKQDTIL
jgi:hypothetical protein